MAGVRFYTTTYCGFCRRAKQLLDELGISYQEIDVTNDAATRAWLVEVTGGRRTVPQIFVGERSIGGYHELRDLMRSGELDQLLAA
jgi:glutaredoxin 3